MWISACLNLQAEAAQGKKKKDDKAMDIEHRSPKNAFGIFWMIFVWENGMLLLFRAEFSLYFWVGPCSFVDMFPISAILGGSPGKNWVYGVRHVRLVAVSGSVGTD